MHPQDREELIFLGLAVALLVLGITIAVLIGAP
jgi:hypothetical protein